MTMQSRLPVELPKSYRLLNHGPTVLVSSAHGGRRNIMAAAWSMPLDFSPPKVCVVIDRNTLDGSVDLVGEGDVLFGAEEVTKVLARRGPRSYLAPDPDLPADTRLWAALQAVSGGTWGGCVYDVEAIVSALRTAR